MILNLFFEIFLHFFDKILTKERKSKVVRVKSVGKEIVKRRNKGQSVYADGRYVWLPVEWEDGRFILRWRDEWDLSIFDKKE